jgi:hypothetical protein
MNIIKYSKKFKKKRNLARVWARGHSGCRRKYWVVCPLLLQRSCLFPFLSAGVVAVWPLCMYASQTYAHTHSRHVFVKLLLQLCSALVLLLCTHPRHVFIILHIISYSYIIITHPRHAHTHAHLHACTHVHNCAHTNCIPSPPHPQPPPTHTHTP